MVASFLWGRSWSACVGMGGMEGGRVASKISSAARRHRILFKGKIVVVDVVIELLV